MRTESTSPLVGLAIAVGVLTALLGPASALACPCDCNGDCEVTVDEVITSIDVGLGILPLGSCTAADWNVDSSVTIDELLTCVNSALFGCFECGPQNGCRANGVVEAGEDCDDGGICVGGSNAGAQCTAEPQCAGNGLCNGGASIGRSCSLNADCPGSFCIRCKPFGGDGCAANCTNETDIPVTLEMGVSNGVDLSAGTSGVVVHGDILTVPMPLTGRFNLTIGKQSSDGAVPFVIRAESVELPQVDIPTLFDACIRLPVLQTCGGAPFGPDGQPSASCTPDFPGTPNCPSPQPCRPVFGAGNVAAGVIACGDTGLTGVDVTVDPLTGVVTFGGSGPQGSVLAMVGLAIGTADGPNQCNDSDPEAQRGTPVVVALTSGTLNDETTGRPIDCSLLTSGLPSVPHLGVVGAAVLPQPAFNSRLATVQLFVH